MSTIPKNPNIKLEFSPDNHTLVKTEMDTEEDERIFKLGLRFRARGSTARHHRANSSAAPDTTARRARRSKLRAPLPTTALQDRGHSRHVLLASSAEPARRLQLHCLFVLSVSSALLLLGAHSLAFLVSSALVALPPRSAAHADSNVLPAQFPSLTVLHDSSAPLELPTRQSSLLARSAHAGTCVRPRTVRLTAYRNVSPRQHVTRAPPADTAQM
jgi:hypothetical protein